MKITLGEWKTRDGRKAIVAAENPDAVSSHRFIGWIDSYSHSWDKTGFFIEPEFKDNADLIAQWTDPVPWDWSTTPPWINWIAMDANGCWYIYDNEPSLTEKAWSITGASVHRVPQTNHPKWSGDWKLSKTERPKEVAK